MASNPLEAAIQALTEAIRNMSGGAQSALGARSAITGAPSGLGNIAAMSMAVGRIVPQLRGFGQEIQRITESFRYARQIRGTASNISGSSSSSYILGQAGNVANSPFLRPQERAEVQAATQAAQSARNQRVAADAALRRARSNNARAARDAVDAQAAYAAAQAQAAALGPFAGAFGPNVQAAGQTAAQTRWTYMTTQQQVAAARRRNAQAATASNAAAGALQNIAGRGAGLAGFRAAASGVGGGVGVGVGVAVGLSQALIEAAVSLRHFSNNINRSNMHLAAYNGNIGAAFVRFGFSNIRREVGTARQTEGTTINLVRAVDSMRDNWYAFDVSVRDLGNRIAALGAGVSGAAGGRFGQVAHEINNLARGLGIGDQNGAGQAFFDSIADSLAAVVTKPLNAFVEALRINANAILGPLGMAQIAAPGKAPQPDNALPGGDAFARALAAPFLGGGAVNNPFRVGLGQPMKPNNWP